MSIGPPLSALEEEPHAVTPTPIARAPVAASAIRAAARGPPCLPPARPKRRLTGREKRVPIKVFMPFPIGLVYKGRGRVADHFGQETVEFLVWAVQATRLGGSAPSRTASTLSATSEAMPSRARVVAEPMCGSNTQR